MLSQEEQQKLRYELICEFEQNKDSSGEEEKVAKKEKPKKATIRLHSKLGPQQVTYRKKEYGTLSNTSAQKPRTDVVAGGGDYEDNDYAESYA